MQFTQTLTDIVDTTAYGPVTFCEFTWAQPDNRTRTRAVVSTAALTKVLRKRNKDRLVDHISKLRDHLVCTDDGYQALHRHGVHAIWPAGYQDPHPGILNAERHPDQVQELLASWDDTTRQQRSIEPDFGSLNLWALDATDSDGPLNLPVRFELTARYIHLTNAQAHLEQHPQVLEVTYERGHPGSYDHVPASLRIMVKFTDEQWKALADAAATHYANYRKAGERPAGPSSNLIEQFLVWPHASGGSDPLGDPLGLAAFAHDSYEEPDDSGW